MAPATAKVTRRAKPSGPERPQRVGGIRAWVAQFLTLKDEIAVLSDRSADLRKRVMTEVEKSGLVDDKGSQFLEFDPPVDFGDPGQVCTGVKREKRTAVVLDTESAETFLQRKGLLEECQTTIVVLDEDKIYGLIGAGKISERDADRHLFKKNVSWAFKPLTAKKRG